MVGLFPFLGNAQSIAIAELPTAQPDLSVSLTGAQWVLVIALSLVAPAFNAVDKAIRQRRLSRSE